MNLKVPDYKWNDSNWLDFRKEVMQKKKKVPLNIYEIDLASWRTRYGKTNKYGDSFLNYRELAGDLITYMKEMGYTHIAILPKNYRYELFSVPDSRFGTAEDFMVFVDELHKVGIGVIMDLVTLRKPVSEIPEDTESLTEEDEFFVPNDKLLHEFKKLSFHWIENFHIDGIRCETDCLTGCEAESAEIFSKLIELIETKHPDVLTVAMLSDEEKAYFAENCGFSMIQNSHAAHGLFEYGGCDPYFRRYHHGKVLLESSEISERFIIPVTHSDVTAGRKSLLDKMFGLYEDKFACYKALMCHVTALPGKKMMFMGGEFGQFREWDPTNQLEWFILDYDMHRKLKNFVADINDFYLKTPEFCGDFKWINKTDSERNVVSYMRKDDSGEVVCVMNFSGVNLGNYYVYVDKPGTYDIVLNSDEPYYGGSGVFRMGSVHTDTDINGGHYLSLNLAKLSGLFLRRVDLGARAVID